MPLICLLYTPVGILSNFLQFKGNFGQKPGQFNEFLIIRQLNEHRREIAMLRYLQLDTGFTVKWPWLRQVLLTEELKIKDAP